MILLKLVGKSKVRLKLGN